MDCAEINLNSNGISSRIIGSVEPQLEEFLALWQSPSPTVEAMTSGSTGAPKPIELSKADMRLSAESTCRFFGLGPESVLGLVLPVDHIAGRMVVVRADVCGGRVYAEHPSSRPLSRAGADVPVIDLLSIVPSQVDGLFESPCLGRIRALLVGGAPIDAEREARLASLGTTAAYATYGMTETCSNVALRRLGQPVFVANEGFTFERDHRGCLVVVNPAMSFGRLVTNDVVRLYDERHFAWVGRADNVINSGGIKIHPEAVEAILDRYLPAGRYYVTSQGSRRWGREVVVVHECDIAPALRAEAEAALEPYMRPKRWVRVGELERTPNGKIRRHSLA